MSIIQLQILLLTEVNLINKHMTVVIEKKQVMSEIVMNFSTGEGANAAKAWKDIWGCGQGIGAIREVMPAADLVARFKREYAEAKARICAA